MLSQKRLGQKAANRVILVKQKRRVDELSDASFEIAAKDVLVHLIFVIKIGIPIDTQDLQRNNPPLKIQRCLIFFVLFEEASKVADEDDLIVVFEFNGAIE